MPSCCRARPNWVGWRWPAQFFFDGPVVIVANEDAVAIAVEGHRHAEARKQAAEQVEIAFGGFGGKERSCENFAGGVVLKTESGESGAAAFEPVVGAAIELDHFALASRTQAALAMSGRAAFARRAETCRSAAGGAGFRG